MCFRVYLYAAGAVFFMPATTFAYVGPGAGITLLPALWGIIAVGLAVCAGVLIWPFRRLWRKFRKKGNEERVDMDHR